MNDLTVKTDYSSIIERFIQDQQISESSRVTYRSAIKVFFSFAESYPQLDKHVLLQYRQSLIDGNVSQSTVSLYITVVRVFFKWAESEGLTKDYARTIKGGKIDTRRFYKEPLTATQAKQLIEATENKRDRALIILMLFTGIRRIEAVRAKVGDISNKGDKTVLWVQGKGHYEKDDFVKLEPIVLEAIGDYLSERGAKDGEPLFMSRAVNYKGQPLSAVSVTIIIKNYLRKIGIVSRKITAHSLRHTFVTLGLMAGVSLRNMQLEARHMNLATTQRYAHDLDRMTNEATASVVGAVYEAVA